MKSLEIKIHGLDCPVLYKIGQNAHENQTLVTSGDPSDLWFHVDGFSSAHVVATLPKNIDRKQRGKIIVQGALLCKQHTAKMKSVQNVPIVYTSLMHVTPTDVDGAVLTRNTNTITV